MALYYYFKSKPKKEKLAKSRIGGKIKKINFRLDVPSKFYPVLSVLLILSGAIFLLFAGMPIFSWGLNYEKKAPEDKLLKPVADNIIGGGEVLAEDKDLTRASNWFVGVRNESINSKVEEYLLTIPKLKIENARVIVGGDDLTKSLIHYGRTAIPGNMGTAVVFGHSVLPQFFNPKNYHTIFATLPEIEVGDEVYVLVDEVMYKYVVYEMETVEPTDISVLEQHFDNYYLYLITCVPPGLDLKRLVVKTKLVEM